MSLTVLGDLTSSMSEANITEELDCGYYLWQVPGKSPAVRLSLDLVDRLGSESLAKFADLTSRGAEIGGILLGHTVDGPVKTVFVDSYEPIQCDYTDSAMFLLSEAAKVRLVERLYEVRTSYRHARLKYLPVGFFRTHARKGLVLDEKDVALMREYFPDPDSIFLLIKPFATKPSLGAIFVRSNGEFQIERTGQFPFKRAELAVRTPEFIVGTTVASNGASGSTEAAAPAEPVSARPPLLDDAQELPASPAPETLGAEERTVDDEQDPLKKVLRQILRNPAESKLFTSRAAEQDSTICVRIASLPGADSSYGPQGETGTFGGALKTVQFPEMPANGSRERTPEREVAGGNASAFGNGHGLNKSRRISARASRAEADQRRGQLWAFAAFGLIIVTVAGYFGLDAKQYRKPAADRTVTEDTKLNLTFQQQGKP